MNATPASMPKVASFTRTRDEFFTTPQPMVEELPAYHPATSVRLSVQKRAVKRHNEGKHTSERRNLDCILCNPCREFGCFTTWIHTH